MRKLRGAVALVIAILLGLAAAKGISIYLHNLKHDRAEKVTAEKVKPEKKKEKIETQQPKPEPSFVSIPEGMRLFSIKVDAVSGISRKLREGDFVDVIATTSLAGKDKGNISRIILQNLQIYHVDLDSREKAKIVKQAKSWTVSLLMTPEQTTILAAAEKSAHIQLVARNSRDDAVSPARAAVFAEPTGSALLNAADDDLVQRIQPGMRAVTLDIKDTDGICGYLKPHDRVDVIVTCTISKFRTRGDDYTPDAEGQVSSFQMRSKILLQNVEVLATEKTREYSVDINKTATRVTLMVSPADAEKLTVVRDATKKSVIRLISRNIHDDNRVNTRGQNLADLLSTRTRIYNGQVDVDVFRGTKRTAQTFFW